VEIDLTNKSPTSNDLVDSLEAYSRLVLKTDRLKSLTPTLFGLAGEVGGLLAASKKVSREGAETSRFDSVALEELGDVLWYFTALCLKLQQSPSELLQAALQRADRTQFSAVGVESQLKLVLTQCSTLVNIADKTMPVHLEEFAFRFFQLTRAYGFDWRVALKLNSEKVQSRFGSFNRGALPTFDLSYPDHEQIPIRFEIKFQERGSAVSYLSMNDVFVGDALTDSISDPDGYRFHDVFHIANATILHWSPTLRSLLKRKRKSRPEIDASEDSGRAIVVEEGLSAYIFSRAKELDFFAGHSTLPFDLLKNVSQFIKGYEVEQCPLSLWERAILNGFEVFLKVRNQAGGIVVADRLSRTIAYRSC
jgi:NTP pyrophosphatase (non-canonical NTP hydrolase)